MITYQQDDRGFIHRVSGVAPHEGRVLLQGAEHEDFWTLPGGRVELLEHSPDALRREMQEEIGCRVTVGPLLWVMENFFQHAGVRWHGVDFVYRMTLPPESPLMAGDGPFDAWEDNGIKLTYQWFPLDSLGAIRVLPVFLQGALASPLPPTTTHIINDKINGIFT